MASQDPHASIVQRQIPGLKHRIVLIKYMQSFAVLSFLLCSLSMFALYVGEAFPGKLLFGASLMALTVSLLMSLAEVLISTNALAIVVEDMEAAVSTDTSER